MLTTCGVDVRKWEAFLSGLAVGSFTYGSWNFHRMLRGRECQISDVLWCDGKHPCTKFVAPRLVFHAFLMMFVKFDIRVRMTTSDCVSVSRWWFTWRHARSVSTHANTDSCTHMHSQVLWCAPPGPPPSPVSEVEQQEAEGWWRLGECNADQSESHLQLQSVMLWSVMKLHNSLTHSLSHVSSQSPTH